MIDPQIYSKGKSRPIDEALKILTDEWIDEGNYCAQTVMDMRDALKHYMKECKKLKKQIAEDY